MPIKVELKGLNEARKYLMDLKTQLPDIIEENSEEYCRKVVEKAKGLAPVRRGRLRDSIGYRTGLSGEWIIFVGAEYAGFVEFGTRYMSPRPFFRPAMDETISEFLENMLKSIEKTARGR